MITRRLAIAFAMTTALSGAAFAADTIKIGLSGPFTGGSSSMGVSMRDGAKLAVEEINKEWRRPRQEARSGRAR